MPATFADPEMVEGRGVTGAAVGADGRKLYSRVQASRFLGLKPERIRYLASTGALESLRIRGVTVFTREALEAYRGRDPGRLAAEAFGLFESGTRPADVVIKLEAEPESIADLYRSWVEMTSAIVVAAPRGSRRAWEKTYRVGKLSPLKIRRALELVAANPKLREMLSAAG